MQKRPSPKLPRCQACSKRTLRPVLHRQFINEVLWAEWREPLGGAEVIFLRKRGHLLIVSRSFCRFAPGVQPVYKACASLVSVDLWQHLLSADPTCECGAFRNLDTETGAKKEIDSNPVKFAWVPAFRHVLINCGRFEVRIATCLEGAEVMKQDRAVFSRWIKLVLSAAVLVLLVGGAWFYRAQMQSTLQAANENLSAIARLKVDQIARWRTERLADAFVLTENPFLADAVARFIETPDTVTSQGLVACFSSLQTRYDYMEILLVAPDGRVLLSLPGGEGGRCGAYAAVLPAAIRERSPMFIDLHASERTSAPHCAVVTPLFAGGGTAPAPAGAIVLVIDPEEFLYPMIQSWPQSSRTAETLLVRREGQDALFLNPLRFNQGAALNVRIPLRQTDVIAVKGLLGERGVVQGLDYRGVSVVGVVEPIPDSPWLMEAKQDAAEVYAVWRLRSVLIMAAVLVLIAAIGAIGLLLSQRERKAHFRTLYQLEAARRAATERHSITLKSIGDGVISTDAHGRVELLNPVAEALTGWTDAEASGRSLQEIFHIVSEDTGERMDDPIARVLREGVVVGLANHTLLIARDGEMRPIADSGAPIRNEENEITGAVLVFRDQSEERRAQQALEKSEAMLKESQRAAALGHYYFDVATGIWSSSEMLDEVYGIDANFTRDVDGWLGLIHPDQREEMASHFANRVLAGRNPMDREFRILRANDGAERWVRSHGALAFDSEGRPVTMFGIVQDVTDRKLKEEALRTSEARYRRAQTIGRVGNWEYDPVTDWFWASEETKRLFGFDPDQSGFTVDEVESCIPDRKRVHQVLMDLIEKGTAYDIEYNIVTVDSGEIRTIQSIAVLEKDADGRPVKVVGVVHDITERKRMEEELRTSEARYRKAQAIGMVGNWEYEPATDWFWGSEETKRIYGFDPDQPGFSPDEVEACIPDRIRVHQALLDLIEKGTPYELEFDIIAVDSGKTKTIRSIAVLEKDADGRPVKVVGVISEITERKLMEEQLHKLNRTYSLLSEVNQMIVHERDTQAVFEAVCRIAVEVGGFCMARIRLPDPQTQQFVPVARAGNEKCVEQWSSAPEHGESDPGLTAAVVRTGKHVVVNDLEFDPSTAAWRNAHQLSCGAAAAFPLVIAGEVYGTLNLYSIETGFFDDEEVRVLDGMAADISFAMTFNKQEQQRRAAEDRTEEHLHHLSALRAIDLAISSSLDLRVTLTILLEQVIGELRVDASAVFLLSPGINQLEYATGRGFNGTGITRMCPKLGDGMIGKAALERHTVCVPHLDEIKSPFPCAELAMEEGFVAMVAIPLISKAQVKGVLTLFHRSALDPEPDWLEFLEALAGQAAIAIDSSQLFDDLQRANMEQALAYDATIEGWSKAMDLRDEETEGHSLRVTDMTIKMARAAGISDADLVHVRRGALLHDMGKMGIPDSILLKPGPLTDEEMTIMRTHPSLAFDMLAPITFLRPALDIPGCHHEKWDGTGYPRGLKGERIPLAARLFAVVDVWDALRSDRPYRKAWDEERVLEHIRALSGTHFDPKAVEVFFRVLAEDKDA
ncbi:hypothetical protein CVU37_14780 [candidate division BRC1 bacterium HGW-BRC1-1]|nr:MAG: hypothetical protein CVU37_14780 [candidate division BRC1 bacterium HGW-BRC1-1]